MGADRPRLNDEEFEGLRALVLERTGLRIRRHKRPLVESRLARRLDALGVEHFAEYRRRLVTEDADGVELSHLINAATTNSTHFFREQHHLEYLAATWLPARMARARRDVPSTLRIWSAGCSTGEEPYSIATTLLDALPATPAVDVKILASDIDTDVLATAKAAIYPSEDLAGRSPAFLARHFLRGTGRYDGFVRVRPEVAALVSFRRINLLDTTWPVYTRFDVIFCRNVLIYFDVAMRTAVLRRFRGLLKDDGVLILGYSESVQDASLGLKHVGRTIYLPSATPRPSASRA